MATYTAVDTRIGKYTLTLTVTEDSYSVANNTSSVSYSLSLKGVDGYYYQQIGTTYIVNVNGEQVNTNQQLTMPAPSLGISTLNICSGTITVPHNNDGTKSITCSASLETPTTQTYLPGKITISNKTLALTTIPRASTMTFSDFTIESSGTFTVTAASNSFTHTITYSFEGLTGTAATLAAGVSTASWTPPSTFYAKLPESTSGTISYELHTFSGATEIGSNAYSGKVKVGSAIKPTAPTITLSPVNTNAWINSQGLYVGGYTKVRVQSSATAGTGATIASYTISGPVSGTGNDFTSANTLSAGSKTIRVTAADTRGRTNYSTQSIVVLSYSNPGITTFKAVRGTYAGGSWTSSVTGDHIRVQAVGSVSLSANGNTGTVTVKIGATNPDATSGNYYYFTSTSATTAYSVTGTITDLVGNTTSRGLTVPSISVPFNIDVDLPGAAAGMIAQHANEFEIANDWALVANGKNNRMLLMPYSWAAVGTAGSAGYARIATVTITGAYATSPIMFEIARRADYRFYRLFLVFASSSGTDPGIESFKYDTNVGNRGNFAMFVYKTGTSTWDVFVRKGENNDSIGVTTYVPPYMQGRISITYTDALLTTVPAGATSASAL